MKFDFFPFLLITLLSIVVNYSLFKWWKKKNKLNSKVWINVGFFLFGIMPAVYITGFLFFWFLIPVTNSPLTYNYFSYFLLLFILVFFPKFVFMLFIYGERVLSTFIKSKKNAEKQYHYPRLSRRKFISQVGIIMATAPIVTLLFGAFRGRYAFYTKHIRLSFPNLPSSFDGLRIVQISDLHLGSFGNDRGPLIDAFNLIHNEHPDIILFTGDIVNNFAGEMRGWDEVFRKLKAPMGKFSILGNHDYGNYSRWASSEEKEANFDGIIDGHRKFGFTLLRNQSVVLERNGETIGLGGVENWGRNSYPRKGDLTKASNDIKNTPFRILMSHDPDHWDTKVLGHGFYNLTLSGHTHGMQFGFEKGDIRWSPAQYIQKRWAGLFREGDKYLYVNRGLGYLGMPARVGMPPEITVIDISRGAIGSEPM